MLKELIRHAGKSGTREVVLGMAHRGRLNVLVNVLGKKPQDLFDEFAGKHKEHLGTGDVKYHMGFSSDIETEGGLVHLALAFNPSHLKSSARWLSVPYARVWIVWTSRAATKFCQSPFTVMRP
jgi:2-oxoglutarate dehydrogenase E1 component